jgi:hypothetical protein
VKCATADPTGKQFSIDAGVIQFARNRLESPMKTYIAKIVCVIFVGFAIPAYADSSRWYRSR